MNVAEKLSEIIDELERAVAYEDWDSVERSIKELNFLYEDMESTFPMDSFDDDY